MNKFYAVTFALSTLLLSACSQPPAPVAHFGSQFFGREGHSSYSAAMQPDYTPPTPVQSAPVASMEVADLAAPELSAPSASVQAPSAEPRLAPLPVEAVLEASPAAPASLAPLDERASNFIWPVEGPVISRFGTKPNGLINDGINIAAREGEPIWAAASGEVVYAGNELKGYGNMVIVRHANGWMSAYAHTSDMLVNKGDSVKQGDLIGYVGKTGAVESAQLHFGIREGKTPIDPESLLPRRLASVN